MINMFMLVGRIVSDIKVIERENNLKLSRITLAVNRKFKSTDGTYHTDFIDCILWNNFAINVSNYCHKGDLIGVRGRIQVDIHENDGVKKKYMDVVAENVTFLSTQRVEKDDSIETYEE